MPDTIPADILIPHWLLSPEEWRELRARLEASLADSDTPEEDERQAMPYLAELCMAGY